MLVSYKAFKRTWYIYINKVKKLISYYNLASASVLMEKAPTKSKLKLINIAINPAVEVQWREGISSKFSLRYINPESNEGGLPHHVWPSVRNSVHDSHKASLKYNLLSGTYMLQST